MQATEDGKNVLVVEKTGFCSVRSINGMQCQRQLSLTPTCCCLSPRGGWIIGFESGTFSEFDISLGLIQSFTIPGQSRAHKKHVTNILPVFGTGSKSDSLFCISSGADNKINFWSATGIHQYSLNTQYPITAIGINEDKLYVAESSMKLSIIDIKSKASTTVDLKSNVKTIVPISGYRGVLVALTNAQIIIVSETEIVTNFQTFNEAPFACVCPLKADKEQGLFSYYCINDNGDATLRCLEYDTEPMPKAMKFITTSDDEIFTIEEGKLIRRSMYSLEKKSTKGLPDLDLPIQSIVKFLSQSEVKEE
jgi:hypothetical protein